MDTEGDKGIKSEEKGQDEGSKEKEKRSHGAATW